MAYDDAFAAAPQIEVSAACPAFVEFVNGDHERSAAAGLAQATWPR